MPHLKPSYSAEPDDIHSAWPSEQIGCIYIAAFTGNCAPAAAVEHKVKINSTFFSVCYLRVYCRVIAEVNQK